MKYIRDKYKINTFIETGTYKGVNLLAHRNNFKNLFGCEINKEYHKISKQRTKKYKNIFISRSNSKDFLKKMKKIWFDLTKEYSLVYLDAHFYQPDKKNKSNYERFVVLQELKKLKNTKNIIIAIHDFCNGLGGITYDGVKLNMKLLKKKLLKVNKKFRFYTNDISGCDIVKTKKDIQKLGLPYDEEMKNTLKFIHSKPEKTYRGILYALPKKLKNHELELLGLRPWK